ncbi:hypothetical protein [Bradyrhizobium sp. SEMIA]|uniref:hypothetical protein n=1 Tax=Bradyrhizobium sp. SEMIA TaxID=2597515 RepID=UPI0018A3C038|nr:hypothetical protein [Bradyrhizobium sp. SEMIA]QOG20417.1 hypothetical protein FOM02_26775 [Bradyrhizobium sp. SEMIA]
MIPIIDILMALLPIILILIALLLACALRIVSRGAAFGSSPSAVAGDPFFYPFGEIQTVPRERFLLPLVPGESVSLKYGRGGRKRDASDFRAWGIPDTYTRSPVALRRNESGGRPASLSGTAVVLTFRGPLTPRDLDLVKARQFQTEEIARVFGGAPKRDV